MQWGLDNLTAVLTGQLNSIFVNLPATIYIYTQSRLPVYYTHTPAGTSVKNCAHYAQEVLSGKFEMYNYRSAEENAKHYNGMVSCVCLTS